MIDVAFFDTECFPNFWLLKVRPPQGATFSYVLRAGESFDEVSCAAIRQVMNSWTVVSFYGNHYDVPVIACALAGYTCEQLHWLTGKLIVEECKHWELGLPKWEPRDHIDLKEVMPGAGSQKQYAGRIHSKRMRDLPYDPTCVLTEAQIKEVDDYCENDLDVLADEYTAALPLVQLREELSKQYGMDLRSKSDAQLAEAVLKRRCEQALGQRIYKPEIDWFLKFRFEPPAFLAFSHPELVRAFDIVKNAIFSLGLSGAVTMPPELEGLEIRIGTGVYRLGIGGLHSSEKTVVYRSDDEYIILSPDVASYYPNLILNSGKYPPALGETFLHEYAAIKNERLAAKAREKALVLAGKKNSPEWTAAHVANEGGKVMINGTFGKTGSPYSVLFAPEMLIQTTITGQLALLMLIEWLEYYGITVISANTDGLVIRCLRSQVFVCEALIHEWETRTGLQMDHPLDEYAALYARDVNNYIAVKTDGKTKRKGEYSTAGLIEKKNPDVEICSDAVSDYLSKGTPLFHSIASCQDVRKFITIQKVTGGAVKLWGEGPRKEMYVCDMDPILTAGGWTKAGRKWERNGELTGARTAYTKCFPPQMPEYLGKVIRWYYSTSAPGSIVYNTNGNTVSLSYGARPSMTLPDEFPNDIDYDWYLTKCMGMLKDLGVTEATQ